MKAKDILQFYEVYQQRYGEMVYLHLSDILADAKKQHKQDIDALNSEVDEFNASIEDEDKKQKKKDFEQSWRAVKGASLENLVLRILDNVFANSTVKIIRGTNKDTSSINLSEPMRIIYESLLIDYKDSGKHLPDTDLIVYIENPPKPIAILSVKTSLRERIAQVAYWASKVEIPYFLITIDSDSNFEGDTTNKSRAIAEIDSDGVYLLTEKPFTETQKVKPFPKLVSDLKKLAESG